MLHFFLPKPKDRAYQLLLLSSAQCPAVNQSPLQHQSCVAYTIKLLYRLLCTFPVLCPHFSRVQNSKSTSDDFK